MRSLIALLLVLCSGVAGAANYPSPTFQDLTVLGTANITGGSATNMTVTPSGTTTARALGVKLNEVVSIADFGAVAGNQQACIVSITASSGALTASTCTFTSDVCAGGTGCTGTSNNLITIDGIGASLSTASISSVPVTSPGTLYTSIPTITVSGGSGAGALFQANMGLSTATVNGAGSGCTPGTQTFTVSGGTSTTAAQFTGTVGGGGTLSGALTVSVIGSYQALPSTSAASVTGGGCSVAPTVSSTWNVQSVTTIFKGQNYPSGTTAAISAGNATVGTPVRLTPAVATYYGIITGFTDSHHVTISPTASQTLSVVSKTVSWGQDNSAAITAATTAATATGAFGRLYVPAGFWLTSTPMQLNPSGHVLEIYGAGADRSVVVAGGAMTAPLFEGTTFIRGGVVQDITFDANRVATYAAYLSCAELNKIYRTHFYSAAPFGTTVVLGDGVTSGCNTSTLQDVFAWNVASRYQGHNDLPLQNLQINETDSYTTNFVGVNASQVQFNVASTAANTHIVGSHVFAGTDFDATTAYLFSDSVLASDLNIDGVQQTGIDIEANDISIVKATLILPEVASIVKGITIKDSAHSLLITGFDSVDSISTVANHIVFLGAVGANNNIFGNPGADVYNPLTYYPFGTTSSLATGAGAFSSAATATASTAYGTNCLFSVVNPISDDCFGRSAGLNSTGNNNHFNGSFTGINFGSGNFETVDGFGSAQHGASRITGDNISLYGAVNGDLLAGASASSGMFGDHLGATCTLVTNVYIIGHSIDCPSGTTSNYFNAMGALVITGANSASTSQAVFNGTVASLVTVVGSLPSCASGNKGARAAVTDANAPTFLGTLTGGSTTFTPVICDGSAWRPG